MASQREVRNGLLKIYDPRQNGAPPQNPPPSFELPNEMIEVKIQLTKPIDRILQGLRNDLRQHNMEDITPIREENCITISGYPPVNGFDQHTVLAIVKRSDSQASLLPPASS